MIDKEKLSLLQWFTIAVEFCGVVLITRMQGAFSLNPELLWIFIAVIALSCHNLFQRRLTRTYSGL
ncbi:MAG: hypothetical protein VB051_03860 [Candidatus Pelethousia sp.]|nr:hypothetical protein [Candidatus Pelethousia sp.]